MGIYAGQSLGGLSDVRTCPPLPDTLRLIYDLVCPNSTLGACPFRPDSSPARRTLPTPFANREAQGYAITTEQHR